MKGKVDIVVGTQFGSEAKGKIVQILANKYRGAVRVGAPNAGHTIIHQDTKYKMRSIPCAWVNPQAFMFIGAGGMINTHVLFDEIAQVSVKDRLYIDPQCNIVDEDDAATERTADMFNKIGSTSEGVGIAQARKVRRTGPVILARDIKALWPYLAEEHGVAEQMINLLDAGRNIIIEGTQGFGLSLNHGFYPYVTSRDVLASSMLSDAGLPPTYVGEVFGVMRTYPIRVAGNSGPFCKEADLEVTWDDIARWSGSKDKLVEFTTVTGRVRRVGTIDWGFMKRSIRMNGVTKLFITFMDYINALDYGNKGDGFDRLSETSQAFIQKAESILGVTVVGVSTGPKADEMVWRNAAVRVALTGTVDQTADSAK